MPPASEFRLHPIHRDASEQYLVVYGQGDLEVLKASDGSAATVTITANAANYMSSGTAQADDLRLVSIADTTLVLNTKVVLTTENTVTTSFTVTAVFDTYTDMVSQPSPVVDAYYQVLNDDGANQKGFYQYVLTASDAGFAKWTSKALNNNWKRHGGWWKNAAQNVDGVGGGFRIRFERKNITSTTGTYTHATRTYTQAGAFSTYTFDSGDELSVSVSGGTLPVGWYPILSRTNDTIVFPDAGSGNVAYRDVNDETATHTTGDDTVLTADYISASGESVEDMRTVKPQSMDEVMQRIQTNLRANTGLEDVNVGFDAAAKQITITSQFRGSDATVVDITDPDTGNDWSDANNDPFKFSEGTATAGTGSPSTDEQEGDERWDQVSAPGEGSAQIDQTTMPIKLTRDTVSPLAFTADVITWEDRLSGDQDTNPAPSIFVDRDGDAASIKLSDISFFHNRLCLLGDENIVFSEVGNHFNLFQVDDENLNAADRIDVALGSKRVTIGDYLVPFRNTITIFTKSGVQFEIGGSDPLDATKPPVPVSTTEYVTSVDVRPTLIHDSMFFVGPKGDRNGVFEYRLMEDTVSLRADDIAAHVPELIPDDIKNIITHPNSQTLFLLPRDRNVIFVYQSFREGPQRQQSAWGKWVFNTNYDIDDIAIIEDTLYMLIHDTAENKRILEKVQLDHTTAKLDTVGGASLPTVTC